ncbi:hypothetical protein [Nonomuraea rubra]|uniref:hypothetical protein n=1 Tax=Nonomuraea rubra TaxID=46180 RepID=UPI0033E52ACB
MQPSIVAKSAKSYTTSRPDFPSTRTPYRRAHCRIVTASRPSRTAANFAVEGTMNTPEQRKALEP